MNVKPSEKRGPEILLRYRSLIEGCLYKVYPDVLEIARRAGVAWSHAHDIRWKSEVSVSTADVVLRSSSGCRALPKLCEGIQEVHLKIRCRDEKAKLLQGADYFLRQLNQRS